MTLKNASEAARKLAAALGLDVLPVCIYGSEEKPAGGIAASVISDCVAAAIFSLASGEKPYPIYASPGDGTGFCRCAGGPAWFGYAGFNPDLVCSMSTEAPAGTHFTPKRLKSSPAVAKETYAAAGTIRSIGHFTVMRRCDDTGLAGQDVRCIVCFGTAGQIMSLCGLAHFRKPGVLHAVEVPWGPSCATLVTYPAGMSDKVAADRVFIGPVDPSARWWLKGSMLAAGIPIGLACTMADDVDRSFLPGDAGTK
jgi:hypothetical protein